MFRRRRLIFLAACLLVTDSCLAAEKVEFLGKEFRVLRVKPAKVRMVWRDDQNQRLFSFRKARAHLMNQGVSVKMLTNGGIYEPKGIPSGLYVENGVIKNAINHRDGPGNFFLKPNGIFLITQSGEARVVSTRDYPVLGSKEKVQWAVQSGPLLLHEGKLHPAFLEKSPNRLLRNGIGVDEQGKIVFAITERKGYCNLWTFAKLFEHLGCANALFLDGDLSRMEMDPTEDVKGHGFATMIAVVE